MKKIRVGIVGYGNLGKGVELAVLQQPDMELVGIFTRRAPQEIQPQTPDLPVLTMEQMNEYEEKIDVMILCGGSAKDLPKQSPELVKKFHIVDSFDTHKEIPNHYRKVDEAAKETGKIGVISVGWDPGLFSLMRLLGETILPQGKGYTFWGKGVSQGHSEAVRRIPGVKDAVQYTIPSEEGLQQVRVGEQPDLSPRQRHQRTCYVVAEEGYDLEEIKNQIVTMPNYFAEYDTEVFFISEEELRMEHAGMPHGGTVIQSANTGLAEEHHQSMEFRLALSSNPEFTSSVLVAYARAAYALGKEGQVGARTIFDIAPGYLSWKSKEDLQRELL